MKRNVLCAAMVLMAGPLMAADKDDVSAAIAKLAAADNYSWTSTNANPGGGGRGGGFGFGAGAADGKAQKTGLMMVTLPGFGGNPSSDAFMQGTNGAIQTQDGWQSLADATKDDGGGGFNPGMFMAMRVQGTKAPADQAKTLLEAAKTIAKTNGVYVGDLTDAGAKALLQPPAFRPGGAGADMPQITITDAKASVKFWIKDGVLSKYEIQSSGKMQFGDQDPRDMDRTTDTEIRDVGATKIVVPEEAKKKLSP
ncbi:MAG: hypothetical protein ABSA47_09315 [Verrucomicrobiota bacterium]